MNREPLSDALRAKIREAAIAFAIGSSGGQIEGTETCEKCGGVLVLATIQFPNSKSGAAICSTCPRRVYYTKESTP